MSVRLKRLYADYKRVSEVFMEHLYIEIKSVIGNPPEKYQIEYKVKGLEQRGSRIAQKNNHVAEIILPIGYPREAPHCHMLTPVFHPNIAPHAICIGDHWVAGESLVDLIIRIGEMICYQSYNIKSPLNGEASKWAHENINRLPIDTVNLFPKKRPEDIIVSKTEVKDIGMFAEQEQKVDIEEKEEVLTYKAQVGVQVESVKPLLPSLEQKVSEITCSNCGVKVEDIKLQKCINGHLVCSDCITECQTCGKVLCVLCSLSKCSSCEKVICSECQARCPLCNLIVCKEHLVRCNICQNEGCSKCFLICSECHKIFCKSHFNERQNRCENCVQTANGKIRITYEELNEIKGKLLRQNVRHCNKCGYKVENNTFFCVMCGSKLK